MEVQILLNCDQVFHRKARYTITMLALIVGFKPRFCSREELNCEVPFIVYGRLLKDNQQSCIFIPMSEETMNFFQQREVKKPEDVCEKEIFGIPMLSLFHNFKNDDLKNNQNVIRIQSDMIANSFYFLSLFEEYVIDERDEFDRFESKNSLLGKLNSIDRPVISEYASVVAKALSICGIELPKQERFGDKRSAVCLTHDIDYIKKWTLGIAYREVIKYFIANQLSQSFTLRYQRLRDFILSVFHNRDPYKISLEKIISLEKSRGFRSTFFIKAGGSDKRDSRYKLDDSFLKKSFNDIIQTGSEIGIHPSFRTYLDQKMWSHEKVSLSDTLEKEITSNRQHYLRFRYPDTFRIIEQNLIEFDSTLAYAEMSGFRNGTCHPFLPYDLIDDRAMNFWEMPLHVMDGTLTSYRQLDAHTSLAEILRLHSVVKEARGVFTILFHNTCYDRYDFPSWDYVFETYLDHLTKDEVIVTTISDTVQLWLSSCLWSNTEEVIRCIQKK